MQFVFRRDEDGVERIYVRGECVAKVTDIHTPVWGWEPVGGNFEAHLAVNVALECADAAGFWVPRGSNAGLGFVTDEVTVDVPVADSLAPRVGPQGGRVMKTIYEDIEARLREVCDAALARYRSGEDSVAVEFGGITITLADRKDSADREMLRVPLDEFLHIVRSCHINGAAMAMTASAAVLADLAGLKVSGKDDEEENL